MICDHNIVSGSFLSSQFSVDKPSCQLYLEGVAERISNYCLAQEYFDCFGPELIFSTNENISCHSARVTSLGNYKKAR